MDAVSLAWIIASIILIIVLLYSWWMLRSFGKAWIATLLVGKFIAGIYYFAGLDRPWVLLKFRNGKIITITVAEAIFLTFFLTLLATLIVVVYGRILPEELRRALSPEVSEQ